MINVRTSLGNEEKPTFCNKFEAVFRKINKTNEDILHRGNLNEEGLTEEERYEYGSIISKIKYLDQKYCLKDFVNECNRIYGEETTFVMEKEENRTSFPNKDRNNFEIPR